MEEGSGFQRKPGFSSRFSRTWLSTWLRPRPDPLPSSAPTALGFITLSSASTWTGGTIRGKQMVAQERRPPNSFSRGMSSVAVCEAAAVQRHLVESSNVDLRPWRLEDEASSGMTLWPSAGCVLQPLRASGYGFVLIDQTSMNWLINRFLCQLKKMERTALCKMNNLHFLHSKTWQKYLFFNFAFEQ